MTVEAAHEMYAALDVTGLSALEVAVLALFAALFGWIAFSFTSVVGGCLSLLSGVGRLDDDGEQGPPRLSGRTALLLPTHNESPARVMAALQAIYESLESLDVGDHFHLFILSDTTDPDIWLAEEAAFLAFRDRTGAHERIFYRHRAKNSERKAGNIAEWVRRFGGAYPQMMVLDADSLMTGELICRLSDAMERHDDIGLIQTLPTIVNGSTLFARAQQFAGRVYGPSIAQGIAWWCGAEGNYWGHNAIIRTQAFADAAGLPVLRGRKPFGGHIMSHDFVEAALLRSAGWAVHFLPYLEGSYEEGPPSPIDVAIRDRRWCQGNLQHVAVLPRRGLHWVSRLHLLMGIGSYVTSPLWLLFLVCGILLSLQARFIRPEYFSSGHSLFPDWPQVDPVRAQWVFIGTMGVLLAPKVLGYFVVLTNGPMRRGCGGALRTLASVVIETLITGLLAPVAMLSQSIDVVAILLGRDSGWVAQRRNGGGIGLREMLRSYARHTVFGLVFAAAAYVVSPSLLLWMMPVVLGLSLAIPLAALTAHRGPGLVLRNLGLLRTPEEHHPPTIVLRTNELHQTLLEDHAPTALARLLGDPRLLLAHRAMLPPARGRHDPIDPNFVVGLARLSQAQNVPEAQASLSVRELAAVLNDSAALDRLRLLASDGPSVLKHP
jgi:membrane glycosyltransferase